MDKPKSGEQVLTTEDRLKAIFYQFVKLYERWSEDRQVLAKLLADVSDNVKKFDQQLNRFEQIEPEYRKKLAELIRSESADVAKKVGEQVNRAVQSATYAQIADVIVPLKNSVVSACQALDDQKASLTLMNRTFLLMLLLGSLLSGIVAAYIVKEPKSEVPATTSKPSTVSLTQSQKVTLQAGEFMQRLWPKLSKQEQQRLTAIGKGKPVVKKRVNNDEFNDDVTTSSNSDTG